MTTKAQSAVAKLIQERDELAEQLLLLEKLVEQLTSYCYPPNGEGGVQWRENLPVDELMYHVHKLFRYRVMQGDVPGMAPTPGENLLNGIKTGCDPARSHPKHTSRTPRESCLWG